jgi:hypothetical protein
MESANGTAVGDLSGMNHSIQGGLAILIACVGFGSAHVPIRKFRVDDGEFLDF